ncbi:MULTISPECIES: hypothetical protein [Streptomyces]|uniref:Uncharacterized protein n=1 Tax=Streptomyces evansiae TaxID=3075535 RepID=A0ABU2QY90_9ACTN|nr:MULTISPECIES: hypothetical protein [unclassified Streptomyces]MDT0409072.1 hypothetical protein [Streptomyces sp. DSM 41979]MYQ59273.1 hypothetical protein [Streptomyces sp. SID4926]SCE55376.1 hypothetical protein GA0115252_16325 [Streptomyces sp. DfronAA-171]
MKTTWVFGFCWRCEAEDVPVLWLGPVQSDREGVAPLYCCDPCIRRLEALVALHHDGAFVSALLDRS